MIAKVLDWIKSADGHGDIVDRDFVSGMDSVCKFDTFLDLVVVVVAPKSESLHWTH